jgi:anti-anti-sigma factor
MRRAVGRPATLPERTGHAGRFPGWTGGGVVVAADAGDSSRSTRPSLVRTGPGRAPGHDRPFRRAAAPAPLGVDVDLVGGSVTLTGRLARHTAHLLHEACSALLTARHPVWIVDVGGLAAIDDAGLRVLLAAERRAVRHGRRISLHGASPALRHALRSLRLDRHLLDGHVSSAHHLPTQRGRGPV